MTASRMLRLIPLFLISGGLVLAVGIGIALGQQRAGAGETAVTDGGPPPAPDLAAFTSADWSESNPAPDEMSPRSPAATFSYYTVAGTTLAPRTSTNERAYGSTGCQYMTSGSGTGLIANTELHLPEGSVIKFIRVYYNDTNASGTVQGFLTRYAPGTAASDLVSASSTGSFSGGFGFTVSGEITETVNNASYAYTLIGWPSAASSTLQVCGIRVAYYAPNSGTFLPVITRD